MTLYTVQLHVTIDHEPGHMLDPDDRVLRVVQDAFADLGVPAEVVIDDANEAGAVGGSE